MHTHVAPEVVALTPVTSPATVSGRASRRWLVAAWGVGAAATAAGTAYLMTHDPHVAGSYPPCVLYAATGLYCPACGGTRALYDLLHGDVAGAFARNPLVPLVLVVAAVWLVRIGMRRRTGAPAQIAWPRWLPVALGAAVLVFGVLRNLPGWEWLSPA